MSATLAATEAHPLVDALQALVGPSGLLVGEAAFSPWGRTGRPLAIVRPTSTAEVSAIVGLAARHGAPIMPWGGRTSLVDGAYAEGALAVSFDRMRRIEQVDRESGFIQAEAGCLLADAADAARAADLLLPLDLGARGSATLGGVVSTNAGGNRVVRWGMTRGLVLGLEVVLADGTVLNLMRPLLKDNAGYDLKQLFIGSEGTLGVITRVVLRLQSHPTTQQVALLATSSFDAVRETFQRLRARLGGDLSAAEVMWGSFYDLVTTAPALGRPPLPNGGAFYLLVEAMGSEPGRDDDRFLEALESALADELAEDVVVAKSDAERQRLWALRDDVAQVARDGPVFVFDVSLSVRDMLSYVAEVGQRVTESFGANARFYVFGHFGDGNLHLCIGVGDDTAAAHEAVDRIVYGALRERMGSISAEHGVGLLKRDYLAWSRTPEEIRVMRALRRTLDPANRLNPGKIFEMTAGRIA